MTSDPIEHLGHIGRQGQALLDRHDQGEDGLPLRHRPQGGLDGGDRRSSPRDAEHGLVAGVPSASFVDSDSPWPSDPRRLGQPDMDQVLVEPRQAVGHERRDTAERSWTADIGECSPPGRRVGAPPTAHDDGTVRARCPPFGCDLGAPASGRDSELTQLGKRDDSLLSVCQVADPVLMVTARRRPPGSGDEVRAGCRRLPVLGRRQGPVLAHDRDRLRCRVPRDGRQCGLWMT